MSTARHCRACERHSNGTGWRQLDSINVLSIRNPLFHYLTGFADQDEVKGTLIMCKSFPCGGLTRDDVLMTGRVVTTGLRRNVAQANSPERIRPARSQRT
jgi:hypothetical protein